MPVYEITSPDGIKLRVTAPDGASQDDVLRYVQSQSAKPSLETRQQAQVEADRKQYDPTNDMGMFGRIVAGYGSAIPTLARGIGQGLGLVSDEDVADAKKYDAPLMRTGAGMVGNIAGNIAAAIPAAFIPGANTVAGSALGGALYGAAEPVMEGESRIKNALTGGAFGGGAMLGMRAIPGAYNALLAPFSEQGRTAFAMNTLNRFAHDPQAINRLTPANLAEIVPGSRPTLAEVTGDPGIAQAQRVLQSRSPDAASAFARDTTQRNQARTQVLRDIAGDESQRDFYALSRETAAKQLYQKAFSEVPTPTPWIKGQLTQLTARPVFREAFKDAQALALNDGIKLVPNNVVQVLHYTKLALDDQISNATGHAQRAMIGTRDKLVSLLESKDFAPSYREARDTFAQMSKPINQMDVGRALHDKLVPALADTGEELTRLRPQMLADAVRNGDKTAQTATGFKGAKLDQILTPEQMRSVNNLTRDLARAAQADQAGSITGSRTAQHLAGQNIMQTMLNIGLPRGWAEWLSTTLVAEMTTNRFASFALRPLEERIQARLAELMLNPTEAMRAQQAITAAAAAPSSRALGVAAPALAIGMGASQ